jgi:threonine/homoserine/homoserine lactone efflux protein
MDTLNFNFLWRGFIIGLTIAVPIGPISVLCIQRSTTKGFFSGFISGFGAATGDVIYAYIGTFSLDFIETILVEKQSWFGFLGGVLLCCLGVGILSDRSVISLSKMNGSPKHSTNSYELLRDYVSTLLINSISPMTITLFIAVFAGLYAENVHPVQIPISIFVTGLFTGSMLWSTLLSGAANLLTGRFNSRQLQWINQIAGITITAFGLAAILNSSK